MSSKVAKELRKLADNLEKVCQEAPCYSNAVKIVNVCTEHLRLLARYHDWVLEEAEKVKSIPPSS